MRYLKLVVAQQDDRPVLEVATELGFDSVPELYRQIKKDGHPICPVCGTTYVEEGHCKQPEDERKRRRAREAEGEARELPSAADAVGLFRDALFCLEKDILRLKPRREYLKGKRFVVEYTRSGEAGESWNRYHRGSWSDDDWADLCVKHGESPDQDFIDVPNDIVVPGGASQAPPDPLTRLIAVYVLADLPIEPLLRNLHPDPDIVDRKQLDQLIYGRSTPKGKISGLKSKAETLARLVRGGDVKPGPPPADLSLTELDAAAYIRFQRQRGASDEQILQELREGYGLAQHLQFGEPLKARTWPEMSMDDLRRLEKLGLGSDAWSDDA